MKSIAYPNPTFSRPVTEPRMEKSTTVRSPRVSVVVVVLAAVFMALLDMFIVNVAFPAIASHFAEANTARLSWVLNGYAIVFAALLVPAGRWADRAGRKRAFLAGLAVFTLASALCASATSVWMLIGGRLIQAAGAALLSPAAMGLLLPEFPPAKRSMAVALFGAIGGVAAAFGAPVGGLLAQLSWHWVFLVNLPIGIGAFLAGVRWLHEIRETEKSPSADLLGALLLIAAIGTLVLAIEKGQEWGWASPRVVSSALVSAAALTWFGQRSRRHPAPVIELPMLRQRGFAAANVSAFLFAAAFGGMILSNVLFLSRIWHSASWLVGLQLAAGPLTAAAVALPAGRLVARWGARPVAIAGALFFAAGSAWLALRAGSTPAYFTQFVPGAIFVGIGIGMSLSSVSTAAVTSLAPSRLSTGSAILNMSRQIGTAVGVAVLVALVGDANQSGGLEALRFGNFALAFGAIGSAIAAVGFKTLKLERL